MLPLCPGQLLEPVERKERTVTNWDRRGEEECDGEGNRSRYKGSDCRDKGKLNVTAVSALKDEKKKRIKLELLLG